MPPTDLLQERKKLCRGNHESAFTHDRFKDDGRNCIGGDNSLKCIFEVMSAEELAGRIPERIRTAIAVGVGNSIDVTNKWSEAGFIGIRFAAQRHR